jgi:hypothetical protein
VIVLLVLVGAAVIIAILYATGAVTAARASELDLDPRPIQPPFLTYSDEPRVKVHRVVYDWEARGDFE